MKWRSEEKLLSCVWLFATPWTVAHQAPWSLGFSRQECWSGLPFPSPGHLPDPGIKPRSPILRADALPSEPPGKPTPWTSPRAQIEVILSGWKKMIFPLAESYEWIETSQAEEWVGENINVKSGMVSWKNLIWCSGKWVTWFQIRVYRRAIAMIKYRY